MNKQWEVIALQQLGENVVKNQHRTAVGDLSERLRNFLILLAGELGDSA